MQALAGHGKASFLQYLWDGMPLSDFEQRSDKMWISILKVSSGCCCMENRWKQGNQLFTVAHGRNDGGFLQKTVWKFL